MGAIQGYLEKLGGNFMVAAFIPSLAFVSACMVAFSPLLPSQFIAHVRSSLDPLDSNGLIVLLIATMMGFTLTSLNTYIYKLFEGYVLIDFLQPLRRIEIARARRIRNRRDFLAKKIDRIEKWQKNLSKAHMPIYQKDRAERIQARIKQLQNKRDMLATEYDLKYPPNDNLILPTRLGNILRAAEAYPQDRYHVDAVALWPRMVWAIDKEYMSHVDAANDQCSFLLNSSLLSAVFASISLASACYVFIFLNTLSVGIIYVLTGIFTLGVAWFFYTASLLNVSKYGGLIRSSYDLFRFNLLEKLHLKLPANAKKEKHVWESITDFVTVGERYVERPFDYPSHVDSVDKDEAEIKSLLDKAGLSDI